MDNPYRRQGFFGKITSAIGELFGQKQISIDELHDKALRNIYGVGMRFPPHDKDAKSWEQKLSKLRSINLLKIELVDQFLQLPPDDKKTKQNFLKRASHHIIMTAAKFLSEKTIKDLVGLAKKHNFQDVLESLEISSAIYNSWIKIKLGDMSIVDFFDEKKSTDEFLADRYFFLAESLLMEDESWYKTIAKKNKDNPISKYTHDFNFAEDDAFMGKDLWFYLTVPPRNELDQEIKSVLLASKIRGVSQEIGTQISSLFAKIQDTRDRILEVIHDPENKFFPEVIGILLAFLKSKTNIREKGFICLGLENNKEKIIQLYRKARRFIAEGVESSFYKFLAESLERFVFNSNLGDEVNTLDDLKDILSNGQTKISSGESESKMTKIINDIFQTQSKMIYSVDPSAIQWNGASMPKGVQVTFDKNRPNKFSVSLTYSTPEEENIIFTFDHDLKRKTFDWSVLNDPELHTDMKDTIHTITSSVLEKILEMAKEEKAKKVKASENVNKPDPGKKPEKRHYHDEIYSLRRKTRRENNGQKSSIENVEETIRSQIINQIVIPLDRTVFGNISPADAIRIQETIQRFNSDGIGFFKKLVRGGFYVLKIGRMRVLLQESQSGNGVRNFEIVDVRYRKDAYRNLPQISPTN